MSVHTGDYLTPARLNTRSVRARRSTTLSLTSGTITGVTFDTEDWDNAAMFAPSSTVITLPVAGLWAFAAFGAFTSNATGLRRLLIDVNATSTYPYIDSRPAVSGDNTHVTLTDTHVAAAGDTLQLFAHQTSGSTFNLLANCRLAAWLIES
ncbi:hypothetical protein [Micromonospora sp. WMMD710]|uniref:hypothetical protein n=1 Tax=Micromonospora sp. WMMD710 TaxID=3016085 RepID=UPI0024173067|nr:hypothetical protein [Micromonospora sp. WMMD710]MDG4762377.1 hypothetical protein [Micromonospora sp. WMMD710]MDG4762379.1 hypothetical protein [Micromonospora sp. WMMD710]MDG4762423.1 hypothetical protein [Micromonospora sp. WMMD710]MDG4762469.1 hypothetical protein [Micromonospora sp. WMMD710]MDG4762504.1 hypothetical protein [Micromonospora sp. WMMD710]